MLRVFFWYGCCAVEKSLAVRFRKLKEIDTYVNIYIGNLSYDVTDRDLQSAFSAFGGVTSAKVVMDMDSGRSKGFGFVEFEDAEEAKSAIKALDGSDLGGRKIVVNEARPREERPRGGGGGYRSGGDFNSSSSFRQR